MRAPPDGEGGRCLSGGARRPPGADAEEGARRAYRALAEAIAEEWGAQGEVIDPATMPLTRFANSILDGVIGREPEVRADILKYAGSDLLCYRAEGPASLVQRQAAAWDRVLAWAREVFNARLVLTAGVMPVAQPDHALGASPRRSRSSTPTGSPAST